MRKTFRPLLYVITILLLFTGCAARKPKTVRDDIWEHGLKYVKAYQRVLDDYGKAKVKEVQGYRIIDTDNNQFTLSDKESEDAINYYTSTLINNKDNLTNDENKLLSALLNLHGVVLATNLSISTYDRDVLLYSQAKGDAEYAAMKNSYDTVSKNVNEEFTKRLEAVNKYYRINYKSKLKHFNSVLSKTEVK